MTAQTIRSITFAIGMLLAAAACNAAGAAEVTTIEVATTEAATTEVTTTEVTTVDGKNVAGEVIDLSSRTLRIRTPDATVDVPTENIISVIMQNRPPAAPQPHGISLRNGDNICGKVTGGSEDDVQIASPTLGSLVVAMSDIAAISFSAAQRPAGGNIRSAQNRKQDKLVLANGDTLPGLVARFTEESLIFDCSLGKVPIPFERIKMVSLAAVGKKYREPDALLLMVACTDGSAITASQATLKDKTLSIRSTLDKDFTVGLHHVSAIRCKNGRLVYLSDIDPVQVKQTPLFDERPWFFRRDRSVGGNPITLQGKTRRKGLGVHSRCELTYDLGGRFKRFLSEVGIDDEIGDAAGGNVEIRVELDGKPIFENKHVSRASGAVSVDLDVTGGRRLTLVADFGEGLHINDHADWADARVIR
ncbi:MAG: NPCBM/NEW2 domain-containing protein [Planctomycetes bacterium]|nr:NPCBM/NEW2 domain-containing protein [Planctomycetota bacterium]